MSDCEHPEFEAQVTVNRIEDKHAFAADVTIQCAKCGTHFMFLGMDMGVSLSKPTVSLDATEARLPIAPAEDLSPWNSFRSALERDHIFLPMPKKKEEDHDADTRRNT